MVLVLAAVTLLLAGCSGDDPQAGPSPTTPTQTPLPTAPTPTPEPGELIRKVKTAKEFIQLADKAETRMLNTGDTAEYLAISKGCVPCEKTAQRVERFYARGGYVKTKGSRIDSIKRAGTFDGNPAFEVRDTAQPTEYRESKSGPIKRLEGGRSASKLVLVKEQFGGCCLSRRSMCRFSHDAIHSSSSAALGVDGCLLLVSCVA